MSSPACGGLIDTALRPDGAAVSTQPIPQGDMQTYFLDVPGATLAYDLRGGLGAATPERPVLVMIGSPMDASGFTTLSGFFGDRPVVTYAPRGVGRSRRTEDGAESTPEQHAD